MNVILKPSGSETANAQSPQGVSDGSRSSGQPVALTRAATALMSCAVDAQSRNPSPFFRSRPFAKSSWPSMMSQAPAFICMPRSPPPLVSQRSPGVKPSTSRYHATLRCRSLTVNDAAMERSRNDSGCWRGGRERGGRLEAALFARAGRLDFRFVAIVRLLPPGYTRQHRRPSSVASCAPPRQITARPQQRRSIPMPTSQASAVWEGKLKDGKGSFKAASGAFTGPYTFATRFEGKKGTNPEELIAAAHAACFSMALSAGLEKAQARHPGPDGRRLHAGDGERHSHHHQDGAAGAGEGAGARSGRIPEGRRGGEDRVPGVTGPEGDPPDHARRAVGIGREWGRGKRPACGSSTCFAVATTRSTPASRTTSRSVCSAIPGERRAPITALAVRYASSTTNDSPPGPRRCGGRPRCDGYRAPPSWRCSSSGL